VLEELEKYTVVHLAAEEEQKAFKDGSLSLFPARPTPRSPG